MEEHRLSVSENRVASRMFGREGVRERERELVKVIHNEELHVTYFSPYIVRAIKSRMRWAEHVAQMGT